MSKLYTISLDLDESVIADNVEQALEIAYNRVKQGDFSLMVVDEEELTDYEETTTI